MKKLRYYQKDALQALDKSLKDYPDQNPLLALPTGSGKSLVIANIIKKYKSKEILVLTHRKELIQQNYEESKGVLDDVKVGIYSASLKKRETDKSVTIASIQSYGRLIRSSEEARQKFFDFIIIDECHLVPNSNESLYRETIDQAKSINEKCIIIGLSATPYRADTGVLTDSHNKVFDRIAYTLKVEELIDKGFLCPLITKAPIELDLKEVPKKRGEYSLRRLEKKLGTESSLSKTLDDLILRTRDREYLMIFCIGTSHMRKISALLTEKGITNACLDFQLSNFERDKRISLFKEKLRRGWR